MYNMCVRREIWAGQKLWTPYLDGSILQTAIKMGPWLTLILTHTDLIWLSTNLPFGACLYWGSISDLAEKSHVHIHLISFI